MNTTPVTVTAVQRLLALSGLVPLACALWGFIPYSQHAELTAGAAVTIFAALTLIRGLKLVLRFPTHDEVRAFITPQRMWRVVRAPLVILLGYAALVVTPLSHQGFAMAEVAGALLLFTGWKLL